MYRPKIKICGDTSLSDCRLALKSGADYCGVVVDVAWSARSLTPDKAAEIFDAVGSQTALLVFDKPLDDLVLLAMRLKPAMVQLTGHESPEYVMQAVGKLEIPVWKSIHLKPARDIAPGSLPPESEIESFIARADEYIRAGASAFVLDTADDKSGKFGGTGLKSDWSVAKRIVPLLNLPVYMAGGIDPDNVAEVIRDIRPYGIDLASGVEYPDRKGVKDPARIKKFFESVTTITPPGA